MAMVIAATRIFPTLPHGRIVRGFLALAAMCLLAGHTRAEDAAPPTLFGSWGGLRDNATANGLDVEAVITTDVLGVVSGGVDTGFEAPFNFDLIFSLDTGTAGWWQNGTFSVYFLGNAGGDPSTHAGDLQVSSSIEAPNTFKVYEAWYEHRFFDNRVSWLVGLRNLNAEFYVSEHAGLFLNSSFGIGPDLSQTNVSIFPAATFGTRIKIDTSAQTYIQAAAFDGVPGDPNDPYGTHVQFEHGDGVFYIGEGGLHNADGAYYKVALGGWYSTAHFDDFAGVSRHANSGIYLIGETDLFRHEDGRGLGVFTQLGFADGDRNQTGTYVGAGVTWTGPLAARPADVAGIAMAHARNTDDFRSFNPGFKRAETTLEFTYLVTPLPWLSVQPDVQYIIDPGTDSTLDDALVLGFRLQIAL